MLQYEAPRIQTNIGDPGQSIANAQRGFAQLGAVAQDIMTREANRTKEEEIAARYAEQVEREIANRKADVDYREKVFNTSQEEKADAKRILALQGQAATLLAAGKTKELAQFLKDNPEANSFDIAKLKVDMDDREKTRSIQMKQLEASMNKDRTPSIEQQYIDSQKRLALDTKYAEYIKDTSAKGIKPVDRSTFAAAYGPTVTVQAINSLLSAKKSDQQFEAGNLDKYHDVKNFKNAAEVSAATGRLIALGISPKILETAAGSAKRNIERSNFFNNDPTATNLDVGSYELIAKKLAGFK